MTQETGSAGPRLEALQGAPAPIEGREPEQRLAVSRRVWDWRETGLGRLLRALRLLARGGMLERLQFLYEVERAIRPVLAACPGAFVDRDVVVLGYEPGRLMLGQRVHVARGTVMALGGGVNGLGRIWVGDDTYIGEHNNLRTSEGASIEIGARCLISQFCTIVASGHDTRGREPMTFRPSVVKGTGVKIGDDVWLGAGSVVLPGVEIGDGVVVGAGSVVTRGIPAFEIWAGNPARKIGERR